MYTEATLKLGDWLELLTGKQCGLVTGLLMLVRTTCLPVQVFSPCLALVLCVLPEVGPHRGGNLAQDGACQPVLCMCPAPALVSFSDHRVMLSPLLNVTETPILRTLKTAPAHDGLPAPPVSYKAHRPKVLALCVGM